MSPDRRMDSALRTRLDEIQVGYERWTHRTMLILAVLVVVQLGFGVLSVWLLGQNAQRQKDLQESRESVIRITCQQQNQRHDSTITTLDRVLREIPPGSSTRAQVEASRAATVLLINALAPHQDCDQRVRQLVPKP